MYMFMCAHVLQEWKSMRHVRLPFVNVKVELYIRGKHEAIGRLQSYNRLRATVTRVNINTLVCLLLFLFPQKRRKNVTNA